MTKNYLSLIAAAGLALLLGVGCRGQYTKFEECHRRYYPTIAEFVIHRPESSSPNETLEDCCNSIIYQRCGGTALGSEASLDCEIAERRKLYNVRRDFAQRMFGAEVAKEVEREAMNHLMHLEEQRMNLRRFTN